MNVRTPTAPSTMEEEIIGSDEQSSKRLILSSSEEVMLFHHREEVGNLISNLVAPIMTEEASSSSSTCDNKISRTVTTRCKSLFQLRRIFDQYLEYSTLLDPFLEEILVTSNLTERIRQIVHSQFLLRCGTTNHNIPTTTTAAVHGIEDGSPQNVLHDQDRLQQLSFLLSTIYTLSKVCGRRKVQRFFPHDASDVEPVLYMLRNFESIIMVTTSVNNDLTPTDEDGAPQLWESIFVLLLWMGMLSYVPFDLTTIDSFSSSNSNSGSSDNRQQDHQTLLLVDSILHTAKHHLLDSGPTREAAASCLAQFLIRRDLSSNQLSQFVTQWSRKYIMQMVQPSSSAAVEVQDYSDDTVHHDIFSSSSSKASCSIIFLNMGILQTLAAIFKLAPERSDLLSCMDSLWEPLILLSQMKSSNTTLRKLIVKLFARVGCAYLPPKVAPWRYQRGKRNLLENLAASSQPVSANYKECPLAESTISNSNHNHEEEWQPMGDDKNDSELINIIDRLEDVMDQLLLGLRDRATVVRWSAAKGIGRVTERLPMICADDVVEALYAQCNNYEKDNAWHGACLALAELARRGLLLPHRLQHVVSIVTKAMQYDIRRGQHSVGSHVRDAACYACWAFARAYSPSILKPHIPVLIQSMVITCLFDREINCRRSASAAFQECVGRQGGQNVPHGIDILTTADYFSLGNRSYAYTTAACSVAKFDEYRIPIIDHVSTVKLFHWDIQIRVLSSKALHDLVVSIDEAAMYLKTIVLPRLLPICTSDDLYIRHGAVLGVSEIILGLGELSANVFENTTFTEPIAALVPSIEKARLYRGRGGEIMRGCVCRLIECISLARIPLSVKQQVRLLDSIDSNLKHPKEDIQQSAVAALHALTRTYFPVGENGPSQRLQNRIVDSFVQIILSDDNAAATRGYSLALGCLPSKLLAPNEDVLSKVIKCLCSISRPNRKVGGESDAETRRNAIRALVQVCRTVGFSITESKELARHPLVGLSKAHAQLVFTSLLESMGDYGTDRRGDVGSWSRVEAMLGLEEMLYIAIKASPEIPHITAPNLLGHSSQSQRELFYIPDIAGRLCYFEENASARVKQALSERRCFQPFSMKIDDPLVDELLCTRIIGAMLKQLSEKMDLVRSVAGACLERILLSTSPIVSFIPQKAVLIEAMNLKPHQNTVRDALANNYGVPSITFPMVVRAMNIEDFFEDIISGIIISVGGITESVVKYAALSLLEWVKIMKQRKSAGGIAKLGNALLHVFQQHQREERVTLPLLKTLEKLFLNSCFEILIESETSTFPLSLLCFLKTEAAGCNSVPRLLSIVNVSLALVSSKSRNEFRQNVLYFVLELLGHSYPRVRRYTAEQLYIKLLEEDICAENHEDVMHLLLEVAWDNALESPGCVRLYRNRVAELMNVSLSHDLKEPQQLPKNEGTATDEFESYQSLVEEAGR